MRLLMVTSEVCATRLRQAIFSLSKQRRACPNCGGALWGQLVALVPCILLPAQGNLDGIKVLQDEVGVLHALLVMDVDARDLRGGYVKGGTALHVASWYSHLTLVQELMRRGAQVRAQLTRLQKSEVSLLASELAALHPRRGNLRFFFATSGIVWPCRQRTGFSKHLFFAIPVTEVSPLSTFKFSI